LGGFVFAALIIANTWISKEPGRFPGIIFSWAGAAFFGLLAVAGLLKLCQREHALMISAQGILLPGFNIHKRRRRRDDSIQLILERLHS
jgi:hypothetical protein